MSNAVEKVFQALASSVRRQVLAYLSVSDMNAGELAEKFNISKPSLSKHLDVLESAGLISREKKGQFIYLHLIENNLANTLNGYLQVVCPVSRSIKKKQKRTKAE